MGTIQLCAYGQDRVGVDLPETLDWYETPADGRKAGNAILNKYPEIIAVWVRKINAGHLRTITMIERAAPEACAVKPNSRMTA